jgi:hypothetical protein
MAERRLHEIASTKVTTTDGTPTAIITYAVPADTIVHFAATIVCLKTDGSSGGGWVLHNCFRRDGTADVAEVGTHAKVGEHKDDPAYDVTDSASGANIIITVTGKAATTLNWWLDGYGSLLTI